MKNMKKLLYLSFLKFRAKLSGGRRKTVSANPLFKRGPILSIALIAALCAASLTGCGEPPSNASPAPPDPSQPASQTTSQPTNLTVFAAASLTEALEEIAALYEAEAPEVTFTFNFDSSGKLQTQIENGAEADLFMSAAQKQMDGLEDGGLIDAATRRNLLVNQVVLITPEGSEKGISSFEDCLTDKVTLMALGNADVPVGQYSEEIFTFLGGWDAVTKKASLGANVKEVLSQVASGSVDCGVVYSTDAATAEGVKVVAGAPEGSHQPVVYPAAVLAGSANAGAAKDFLDYLGAPEATAVFERIGFTVAE
ncbi:MAG: molybdate ABC transporter substrate-binding protein [Clostridiales Family XIII bacterium]|jgi:molybdate transport system substrate-binding protein|nr:molybdate ABC transporter substrate-binding protein [Clostridiales Family XIII bacterium]